MGEQMEDMMARDGGQVAGALTARQVEVVLLIGRDGLSYKAAAQQLGNKLARVRDGMRPPTLSHHTVRRYANEIRDLFGLGHLSPMRACWIIFSEHRSNFEEVELP